MAKEPLKEDFWTTHAGTWTSVSGSWRVKPEVVVQDFSQKDIYRSSQTPSHVEWAGIRMEREGLLKISFIEARGTRIYPPTYGFFAGQDCGVTLFYKTIVSRDNGKTWKEWGGEEENIGYYRRPPVVLRDGSLLQLTTLRDSCAQEMHSVPVFKKEFIGSPFPYVYENMLGNKLKGQFRASSDGGRTWKYYPALERPFTLYVTVRQISDGTVIAIGGMLRHGRGDPLAPVKPDVWDLYLSESYDKGKTWTAPKAMPRSPGKLSILGFCEEVDFVALEKGRFVFLVRVHPTAPNLAAVAGTNVVQFYGERKGRGKWSFSKPEITTMPHSGFPQMLKAKDGAIIYHNHAGIFFSLDEGKTWIKRLGVCTYYPSLVQLPDGAILATCHTLGGDTPYLPDHDMAIKLMRFRYKRTAWLEQTDNQSVFALKRLDHVSKGDFHLSVDLRHDGCEGVAFHIKGDEAYVVYLHTPRSPQRVAGNQLEPKDQTFLAISRIKDGAVENLATKDMGKLELFTWCKLQISVKGNRIDAAVYQEKLGWGGPLFLAAEKEKQSSGLFGVFSDLSTAAFTNMRIWPSPEDMRIHWGVADFSSISGSWHTLP